MGSDLWKAFIKCGFCGGDSNNCCCFNSLTICSKCSEGVSPWQAECPNCGAVFDRTSSFKNASLVVPTQERSVNKSIISRRRHIPNRGRVASKGILPYFDHYAANTIQKGLEGKYVCVVGGMSEWQHHAKYGSFCDESRLVQEPKSVNLVILIGGADISPSIYRHHEAPQTAVSPWADRRDEEAYTIARENNIPIVGICRGGQFLIAKAGGFLYQHTTGHGGGVHKVTTSDGKTFMVTSAHHQMFGVPLPEKAELLAWSAVSLSSEYIVGGEVDNDSKEFYEPEVEPECVWLPNINALAIQWHPEWMKHDSEAVEFHLSMIEKYMGNCIAERNKDELSVILSEDNKQ